MSGSVKAVSRVTLPNGQNFTLAYDPTYGMLNKMTYPSGGYVRYVWGLAPQEQYYTGAEYDSNGNTAATFSCRIDYPAITDRYVSFNGTSEVLHQHFSYSTSWQSGSGTWTTKTTTVTTTDQVRNTSFSTVYSYSPTYAPCVPDENPNANDDGCVGNNNIEQVPVEQCIEYYDASGSGGTPPSPCPNLNPPGKLLKTEIKSWYKNDPRTLGSVQTMLDTGQSSLTVNCYNSTELLTESDSYDLGTTAVTPPACSNGVPSGTAAGPLLRRTVTTYSPSTTMSIYNVIDEPSKVQVYDSTGTNLVAETDYTYDSPLGTVTSGIVHHTGSCNCGNLTKESRWINSSGSTLATNYTNDDTGQRLTMSDPRGDQTTYSYADSYSSGTPPGPTNAYLTQVTHPNTGYAHIEKFSYAYASGEVTSSTDQNNQVTNYKYNDSLARLTETDFPDGGVTTMAYNDSPYNPSTPSPSVTTTKKMNSSQNLVTVSATDGLGHVLNNLVTSDPQGTIHTDTAYDGLARVYTVSNPYRSGTDPTTSSGITTYIYDSLGRKCVEVPPDGAAVSGNACPTSAPAKDLFTQYSGSTTTVTDQTGKKRQSTADGLGRLIQVVEDPGVLGYVTNYTVDTLGNLKQVVQNGSHTRAFTYDFLSRLLTSNNPEVGTIMYNYDSDANCASPNAFAGLLVSKVDARGIRTCAQYDALNRVTQKNYSDGTQLSAYAYDQTAPWGWTVQNPIGRLTNVGTYNGSWNTGAAFSYDPVGRKIIDEQCTSLTVCKTLNYSYDLAGNNTSITYPSGRIVNYTYDAATRPATAVDSANGITYAAAQSSPPSGCLSSGVCYTPQGSEYSAAIGKTSTFNGVNLSETYNSRLQPLEIKASSSAGNAFDITYSFVDPTSGGNAGHVNTITNNLNSSRSQSFAYDHLNRIVTAGTTATSGTYCWGYQYNYDAWANLLAQAGWSPNYNGCSEATMGSVTGDGNNHISGLTYDASGNTQNDGTVAYTYDAESQMKTAAGVTYTYDAQGRRVSKSNGKNYIYELGGEILVETDGSGNTTAEYVFFGGKRIAMLPAGGNPEYYAEDFLGSSRVMTQNNGALCYDADFDPYGGEHPYTNTCPSSNAYKFEGKERDAETGNDDFGARYYTSRFGRWLSADWSSTPAPVPYANLTNPQTLNLYSMVADDPESFADLQGHEGGLCYGCGPNGTTLTPLDSNYPTPPMSETEKQVDKGIIEVIAAVLTGGLAEDAAAAGKLVEAGLKGTAASGLFASGTTRIIGSAAGASPKELDEAAGATTTMTNPAGAAVTLATGNVKMGEKAADLSSASSLAKHPSEALKNPADATLTVSSVVKDIKDGTKVLKNVLTTVQPPPTPRPPRPPSCLLTQGGCH